MADLAGARQRLEARDRLGKRDAARPMQEVEVEPVGPEPAQAALAGLDDALAARVVGIDLADEEDLSRQVPNRLADELLGPALAVHLGGVDQGHAELDAEPERRDLLRSAAAVLPHAPGALAERDDLLAAGDPDAICHCELLVDP